jgi:preprotein translocase subunit SecB
MADENNTTEQQDQQQQSAPAFQLERCYMKDASVEMPHAPEVFVTPLQKQPTVDMQFEVSLKTLNDIHREVTVRATVTIKAEENVILIAEVKQAGIFQIHGFNDEQLAHIGNVICPTIVYPYLRANVADLITRTTMAPVNLPEMNFELLYQQRLAQAAAAADKAKAEQQN